MAAITVSLSRIEPVRIEEKVKIELAEASLALAKASDRLGAGLPPETLAHYRDASSEGRNLYLYVMRDLVREPGCEGIIHS